MTEEDYILIGDLKTIIAAKAVLSDICAANNPHIPDADFEEVMRLLRTWNDALFAAIDQESSLTALLLPDPAATDV